MWDPEGSRFEEAHLVERHQKERDPKEHAQVDGWQECLAAGLAGQQGRAVPGGSQEVRLLTEGTVHTFERCSSTLLLIRRSSFCVTSKCFAYTVQDVVVTCVYMVFCNPWC